MTEEQKLPSNESLEESPEVKQTAAEILASNPRVQEAIATAISQITGLIERNITIKAKWITVPVMVTILFIIAGIIGAVTFLAVKGNISSDAVTFLLGTIVGASFTFLQRFLPNK